MSDLEAQLCVEDDGIGRDNEVQQRELVLGTRIVRAMAQSMNAR